jgi:glycosyltransferase involved in cell wall biosynthesis
MNNLRAHTKKEEPDTRKLRLECKELLSVDVASLEKKYFVSIILPTFNRASVLENAVRSALRQRFRNFELIISDDGSNDNTADVVSRISDSRIRYIASTNGGVSAARNRAMDIAGGNVLAFLDSDNTWTEDHLQLCLAKMEIFGLDAVYGILQMVDGASKTIGWRANQYDFAKLSERNYIDLNVFVTRVDAINPTRFDEQIRRAVDWDYIIRTVRGKRVELGYFVSANYLHDEGEESRLTNNEYTLYTKIVRARNFYFPGERYDRESVLRLAHLRVAIHICAPKEKALSWGDYYYGLAIQKYLNLNGFIANIIYANSPAKASRDADINIAIVGRSIKKFPPNKLNIAWIISHPEIFTQEMAARFRIVFSASPYFTRYLQAEGLTGARLLQQASDLDYFHKVGRPDRPAVPCIFVGSSKGVSRPFIEKLCAAFHDARVIGEGWQKKLAAERIISNWIDNAELPRLYRNSSVVLSEHWRSMRLFGIVANRVSDALSAGAHVVSDNLRVPQRYIPDNLTMCKSIQEASEAISALLAADASIVDNKSLGVSFQQQVASIAEAIHDNVFNRPYGAPQADVTVEVNADLSNSLTEWYVVNVLLAHVHEEALETTKFTWLSTAPDLPSARVRWRHGEDVLVGANLEDLFYKISLALNQAAGAPARKRVVLDEKIWRIFSVGRRPHRSRRLLTIISDDVQGLSTRLKRLKQIFVEIRVWTPTLTHRTVIKGSSSTVREFRESTRSRIRHFLQDTASHLGLVDVAHADARIVHALVAGGCHVIYNVHPESDLESLLQREDLQFAALDLVKEGGWEKISAREMDDPRDKYWSLFGDPDYPTFQ